MRRLGRGTLGRVELPDAPAESERFEKDDVGRLGRHVLSPLRARPTAGAVQPATELQRMTTQDHCILNGKQMREVADE